jgi:MFS family permease
MESPVAKPFAAKSFGSPVLVLIAAMVVVSLALGIRSTMGLFLRPMTADLGWGREVFAFAIALQNLLWGAAQPFTGMIADRYGTGRVIAISGVGYALGLAMMATADHPFMLNLGLGVVNGLFFSGVTFSVVLGAVSRAVPAEKRGMAMGIASSGGSVGQFVMLPLGQWFIDSQGWATALILLAAISLFMVPMGAILTGKAAPSAGDTVARPGRAFLEAVGYRQYWLMFVGFFVCGFHVSFVATHLPAYLVDNGIAATMGATALALIGFFNIFGSLAFGALGDRFSKKKTLAFLYLTRGAAIAGFMAVPLSNASVLVFAAVMGFTWLGTVPLTNGLVGQVFGARYMATLSGFVFFGHQIGAFIGVWLGGLIFDLTGSYNPIWYAGIALGVFAAAVHWPIDERPLAVEGNAPEPAFAGK